MAAGRERHGFPDPNATVDTVGRDRLAQGEANLGSARRGLVRAFSFPRFQIYGMLAARVSAMLPDLNLLDCEARKELVAA